MRSKLKPLLVLIVLAMLTYAGVRLFGSQQGSSARLALGTLERDRVTLSATASEIILAQPVREGSHVQQGTLLVQLDTTIQQAAVEKVLADIAQLEAVVLKLRNGFRSEEIRSATARVETAKSLLAESERELKRLDTLATQQLVARVQLDTLASQRDTNASRLRDAEAQLALLRAGSRNEDITQAESQLTAARALLVVEQKKLANLSVTSTVNGILDSLPWNTGERVNTGSQIAILLADGAPYVRAFIPETARAQIQQGSSLLVHVDGVPGALQGTVRWISQDPAFTPYYALNGSERSRLVYMAEVQLTEAAQSLPAGLPAQVELP